MQSAASVMQPECDKPMYGTIGILPPMMVEKTEEVANRACRFVLFFKFETELGCQASLDELASAQHAYLERRSWTRTRFGLGENN